MFRSVQLQQFCVCWEPLEESYASLSVHLLPSQLPSVHPDAWGQHPPLPPQVASGSLSRAVSCTCQMPLALLISVLTALCSPGRDGG